MSKTFEESAVFGIVSGNASKKQIAESYARCGWKMHKCGWGEQWRVDMDWGELVIEGEGEILIHGPINHVEQNIHHITEPLNQLELSWLFECYDENHRLLKVFNHSDP